MAVRFIVDSGSDFAAGSDPRVTVLPLSITFGSTTYLDGVDIDQERFYELLVESDELPTTSQITPYAFGQAFEEVRAAGDEAVVVTLSSHLSGTWGSAVTAAADYPEVHVVDSKNVSVGEKILLLHGLALADDGLDAAAIAARLEALRDRVRVIAALDTLEYLRRGGRIPAAAGALGELLAIKPVVGVVDGSVALLGRARGSKNARNLLHEEVGRTGIDFGLPIELGYTGLSSKVLRKYLEDSRSIWEGKASEEDLPITCIGATVGTHVGPGAVAVAFFAAE